jgi:hypothetical protein
MTSEESFLTRAPMTPRDVRRRYSKGRDLDVVLRNGYRKSGMWAVVSLATSTQCGVHDIPLKNKPRVSVWEATHWRSARALQTRFDAAAVNCEGLSSG